MSYHKYKQSSRRLIIIFEQLYESFLRTMHIMRLQFFMDVHSATFFSFAREQFCCVKVIEGRYLNVPQGRCIFESSAIRKVET